MYLMKPHDWKSSSSCWITWGLAAVPPLQIPPIPSVFSVCSIHLADPPACWIQLCLPHVHAHQAGGRPSRLADWARFKLLTARASRRPLVGGDSAFLSAFLSCSSRCFCPPFPFGDLASAPLRLLHPRPRSVSPRVQRQWEGLPPSLTSTWTSAGVCTRTQFPPLPVGTLSLFLAQALLARVHPLPCLLRYSGTPLQQLFPTLLRHQVFPQTGLASHWGFISSCHVTAKLPEIVC